MLDKLDITLGPCPLCDKTVQMDGAGIIARHECLGTWHIVGTPFATKEAAAATAKKFMGRSAKWRVIPRRSRWIIQAWRAVDA